MLLDIRRPGYFLASESVLREICTLEEFERIKKASVPYEGDGCGEDMYDSDSTDSSADLSSLALVTKEAAEGCGVISLADGPPAMRSGNDQGKKILVKHLLISHTIAVNYADNGYTY